MKNYLLPFTLIILLLAGGYFFFNQSSFFKPPPPKYTGPVEKIILGVDFSDILSTPVLIAENQGYFREEGLDVQIMEYPSGRTALKEMVSGENLDIVTVAQTPVMYNSFISDTYAIIAGMSSSYSAGSLILARQDKEIKTAQDLKGKKIGTPIGSTGHFFLHVFLTYNGLKVSDVETIDIEPAKLPQALDEGTVDAISIWQPQIYNAQKLLGEKTILFPSGNVYRVDFYLVANKDFVNNKPGVSARFLKAINRAQDFIRQNKEISIDIVSGRLNLNRDTVATLWDEYQFKLFLDQPILTDLEDEARWAIKNKLTDKKELPNYLDYIYFDALEAVKPEAITIIR